MSHCPGDSPRGTRFRHRFRWGKRAELPRVVLVGNPNVGKSLIFNCLTRSCVDTANYPGVTVGLTEKVVKGKEKDQDFILADLPGIYGFGGPSEDQKAAWDYIFKNKPDLLVAVLDSTNLSRNLFLLMVLMALDMPLIVAGTFGDKAEQEGEPVNWEKLSRILEIPVIPVVAPKGRGITQLYREIQKRLSQRGSPSYPLPYPEFMRNLVFQLEEIMKKAGLPPRRSVFLFFMGDQEIRKALEEKGLLKEAEETLESFLKTHGIKDLPEALFSFHHSLSRVIAQGAQKPHTHIPRKLEKMLSSPISGSIAAILLLLAVFSTLFLVGGWLSELLSRSWQSLVSPYLQKLAFYLLGEGPWAKVFLWGFDEGILAALTVGIPYILIFYFILAFLEDTGYLSVLSFLGERLTRLFGLPGRALINLVASAGCNVPALSGTRILPTMRERFIASLLILLVPCSARSAVIFGAAAPFLGIGAALSIYALVGIIILIFGTLFNRVYPGKPSVLIAEIPPLRWPQLRLVLRKTWFRFSDFLYFATPILIFGSLLLGSLYETGVVWSLMAPLRPIIEGWMGLPVSAGLAILFAFLRKEMSLQLLLVLAAAQAGAPTTNLLSFMTPAQLYVFVFFITISFPCLSAFSMLLRELKAKRALIILLLMLSFSILTSGFLYRFLTYLGFR
ncbi:MAG: ferrous iron transport protein B [Caldiserica bacterium]|nr:ferrous iron transport protein B [Caldisericota bacterium]MDH7562194.1 ferrous iron transport protein B [Caldisericota bacterium]